MVKSRNSTTGKRRATTQKRKQTPQERIAEIVATAKEKVDGKANMRILDVLEIAGFSFEANNDRARLAKWYDTEVLGVAAQTLLDLEDEYGAFEKFGRKKQLATEDRMGIDGWARWDGTIALGNGFGNGDEYKKVNIGLQDSGYFIKIGESTDKIRKYVPTHEYGHMIAYALYQSTDGHSDVEAWYYKKRNEVIKIAREKYGYVGQEFKLNRNGVFSRKSDAQSYVGSRHNFAAAQVLDSSLSMYSTDRGRAAEFFSEAFAQYKLGDGPLGKAYGDWLKQNYKKQG